MWATDAAGADLGVVGIAVGAPFAVLVAEQLHASGAQVVLSITSAGQLTPLADPPYFVLIDRARRDECTSAHYQPPAEWSRLSPQSGRGRGHRAARPAPRTRVGTGAATPRPRGAP